MMGGVFSDFYFFEFRNFLRVNLNKERCWLNAKETLLFLVLVCFISGQNMNKCVNRRGSSRAPIRSVQTELPWVPAQEGEESRVVQRALERPCIWAKVRRVWADGRDRVQGVCLHSRQPPDGGVIAPGRPGRHTDASHSESSSTAPHVIYNVPTVKNEAIII